MPTVKVYALSTCPWCRKAQQFLKSKNVIFECVEYDLLDTPSQQKVMEEMRKAGGGNSFPLVLVGEKAVEGYNPESYCQLLGIKNEP